MEGDGLIRIDAAEANSRRVDDLLSRQKNMRGEAAGKGPSAWYFQSWFLYGMVGLVTCFVGWALIEPHFDDFLYVRGKIEACALQEALPYQYAVGRERFETAANATGWVRVKGETIWLADWMYELYEGKTRVFDDSAVAEGMEVGLYVAYTPISGSEGLAIAHFIELEPTGSDPGSGLTLAERARRDALTGILFFPLFALALGFTLGAVDAVVCRQPLRALGSGTVGSLIGFVGGFIALIPSGIIYGSTSVFVEKEIGVDGLSTTGFLIQIVGRGLAWGMVGMVAGLGPGIVLRSWRLLTYGLIGGLVGGLLGGLAFDPIDLFIQPDNPSSALSRMIGLSLIGLMVGAMIGVVELLARDAWLRMVRGPLQGKEFLLFRNVMQLGASPKSHIYLFNDAEVLPHHATLRAVGEGFDLVAEDKNRPVRVNQSNATKTRLRDGDEIHIGRTVFVYHQKRR